MAKKNKIILSAETNLEDNSLRKVVQNIYKEFSTKIQTINDRTKAHTIDIKKLEKQVKELRK